MRILGEPFTDAERADVIEAARSFLGCPWRHQGRRLTGIDCLGLVALSYGAVRPVVDRSGYGRTPYNRALRESLVEHFGLPVASRPVSIDDLQSGDLVTMRWTGEEQHVAIVTPHPHGLGLIHSYASAPGRYTGGQVVEHRITSDWLALIHEGFRP